MIDDRNRDIVEGRLAGVTLAKLGEKHQVTRQGVHAIFEREATDAQKKQLADKVAADRKAKLEKQMAGKTKIPMSRLHVLVPGAAGMDSRVIADGLAAWVQTDDIPTKQGRGGERIDIYLPAELKNRIYERCAAIGVKVSDAVRYVAAKGTGK